MTAPASALSASTLSLLETLKQLYRAHGIRYKDAATLLGVSEVTVKRYFSGHGLTLQMLERLCDNIGIDLFDLCDLARGARSSISPFH
jgi:predicted transcriptional regulator